MSEVMTEPYPVSPGIRHRLKTYGQRAAVVLGVTGTALALGAGLEAGISHGDRSDAARLADCLGALGPPDGNDENGDAFVRLRVDPMPGDVDESCGWNARPATMSGRYAHTSEVVVNIAAIERERDGLASDGEFSLPSAAAAGGIVLGGLGLLALGVASGETD